jgi:hypothetical protein
VVDGYRDLAKFNVKKLAEVEEEGAGNSKAKQAAKKEAPAAKEGAEADKAEASADKAGAEAVENEEPQ